MLKSPIGFGGHVTRVRRSSQARVLRQRRLRRAVAATRLRSRRAELFEDTSRELSRSRSSPLGSSKTAPCKSRLGWISGVDPKRRLLHRKCQADDGGLLE